MLRTQLIQLHVSANYTPASFQLLFKYQCTPIPVATRINAWVCGR